MSPTTSGEFLTPRWPNPSLTQYECFPVKSPPPCQTSPFPKSTRGLSQGIRETAVHDPPVSAGGFLPTAK